MGIELELQENKKNEEQKEGTIGNDQPGSPSEDDYDEDEEDDSLPDGWKACLTDDGMVYYQNDITQKTSWNRPAPILEAPPPPYSNDNGGKKVPLLSTSRQAEPEQNQTARNEAEAHSDKEEDENVQYVLPMNAKETNRGREDEDAGTPLVTKGMDLDDLIEDDDNNQQNNLMQEIEQKQNEANILLQDDQQNEYVPPAPAAPQSPDEITKNQKLMEAAWKTPGFQVENENDDDDEEEVELEQSISLDYNPEQK